MNAAALKGRPGAELELEILKTNPDPQCLDELVGG